MGTDCAFIAKVKNEDSYEGIYLDRYYVFCDSDYENDYPNIGEWRSDINEVIEWCNEAILHYWKHTEGATWYAIRIDTLLFFINENKDRWEKFGLFSEHKDEYDLNWRESVKSKSV